MCKNLTITATKVVNKAHVIYTIRKRSYVGIIKVKKNKTTFILRLENLKLYSFFIIIEQIVVTGAQTNCKFSSCVLYSYI